MTKNYWICFLAVFVTSFVFLPSGRAWKGVYEDGLPISEQIHYSGNSEYGWLWVETVNPSQRFDFTFYLRPAELSGTSRVTSTFECDSSFRIYIDGRTYTPAHPAGWSHGRGSVGQFTYNGGTIDKIVSSSDLNLKVVMVTVDEPYNIFVGEIWFFLSGGYNAYSYQGVILEADDTAKQLTDLNEDVQSLNSRTTALELWKQAIETTILAVQTQLDSVKQWLFFWNYQGAGENICDAVANECEAPSILCSSNADCGVDGWVGSPSCSGDDVWQDYKTYTCHNPGKTTSYCTDSTAKLKKADCPKKCLSGVCVDCLSSADCPSGQSCVDNVCSGGPTLPGCTFRTNVVNGDYYNSYDWGWIAYDFDKHGSLEGMGISARGSWSSSRCNKPALVVTPTGDKLIDYGHSSRLILCDIRNNRVVYFDVNDGSGAGAELSSSPTDPYTANAQEVCTTT